jgi:hypothetical protein
MKSSGYESYAAEVPRNVRKRDSVVTRPPNL